MQNYRKEKFRKTTSGKKTFEKLPHFENSEKTFREISFLIIEWQSDDVTKSLQFYAMREEDQ